MEHELRSQLLEKASALNTAKGLTEETIGLRAIKDNTFFKRIRNGAGFTVKTYDRLMSWMEAEMPAKPRKADRRAQRDAAA